MKPKIEIGWKVVRESTHLLSAARAASRSVIYKYDKWTRPKSRCGPLAVFHFDAKKEAQEFARKMEDSYSFMSVVLCEYLPSARRTLYRPLTSWDKANPSRCQRTKKSRIKSLSSCPPGTRFARAVRLIDE